ncbi:hypothetical protein MHTCC0001_25000 [Flavobacteriaceae bacterium MHTCC 0001]
MKKPAAFLVLLLVTFSLSASNKNKANNDKGKTKVLVVSFIEKNFESTYLTYEIAEKNSTDSETVFSVLEDKIFSALPKNGAIEFIKCANKLKQIENSLSFSKNKKDILIPNLSEIDNDSFNKLLETNSADYILFISTYEMNWIGDPQYKVENNLHFTILGKDKKEIASNKYGFSTPKLTSFEKMKKKIHKATEKIYIKHFLKLENLIE